MAIYQPRRYVSATTAAPRTPQDAWRQYQRAIQSGNYPGSSGYWGGVPGAGAPGDVSKEWLRKYYLEGNNSVPFDGSDSGGPPDFTVTKTPKDPATTDALNAVTERSRTNAADAATQFQAYLKEALASQASQKAQLEADKAALDTRGIEAQLPAINRSYEAGQNQITTEIARRNQEKAARDAADAASVDVLNEKNAANTAARIARMNAANDATLEAARRVGAQSIAAGRAYNAGFDVASNSAGGPNAQSGRNTNREQALVSSIMTPIELGRAQRAYAQIGQYEAPWELGDAANAANALGLRRGMASEAYGNDQALFGRRSALESDFAARGTDTARYLYELKARTAGRANELETQYLDSLLRKAQAGQQMTAADIANVRQLTAAYQDANWYTANTPLDRDKLLNPIGFTPNYPERNYSPQGPPPQSYPDYGPRTYTGSGATPGNILPAWVNAQRKAAGWQMDENGQYTRNTPADPGWNRPGENWGDWLPGGSAWQDPPPTTSRGGGGGFTVGPEGVTGLGSFENLDWSRSYERGRTPGEKAYYDAIAAASQ